MSEIAHDSRDGQSEWRAPITGQPEHQDSSESVLERTQRVFTALDRRLAQYEQQAIEFATDKQQAKEWTMLMASRAKEYTRDQLIPTLSTMPQDQIQMIFGPGDFQSLILGGADDLAGLAIKLAMPTLIRVGTPYYERAKERYQKMQEKASKLSQHARRQFGTWDIPAAEPMPAGGTV